MVYILGTIAVVLFLGVCTAIGRQDQEIKRLRDKLYRDEY